MEEEEEEEEEDLRALYLPPLHRKKKKKKQKKKRHGSFSRLGNWCQNSLVANFSLSFTLYSLLVLFPPFTTFPSIYWRTLRLQQLTRTNERTNERTNAGVSPFLYIFHPPPPFHIWLYHGGLLLLLLFAHSVLCGRIATTRTALFFLLLRFLVDSMREILSYYYCDGAKSEWRSLAV